MSIKREFELVNSVNANFKTNSQSKEIKLLPNAALLVGELLEIIKKPGKVRKVGKNRFGKDGQKIMLKLGEKILLI